MATPTSQALTAAGLRVEFVWQGDRFRHSISAEVAGVWHELLRSVEGLPEDDWPQSPALQQMHFERRDATPVALLVGMAGRSHWSLSAEVVPDELGIVFDVACRCRAAEALGSTYQVVRPPATSDENSCRWEFVAAATTCELRLGGASPAAVRLEAAPAAIRILPATAPSAEMQTVLWRYELVRLSR